MVGFKDIITEFTPKFISLRDMAKDLRDILFLIRGKLFTGTYKDRNIIYNRIINTFNKVITYLEELVVNI
jgi:hypothetical protein